MIIRIRYNQLINIGKTELNESIIIYEKNPKQNWKFEEIKAFKVSETSARNEEAPIF